MNKIILASLMLALISLGSFARATGSQKSVSARPSVKRGSGLEKAAAPVAAKAAKKAVSKRASCCQPGAPCWTGGACCSTAS